MEGRGACGDHDGPQVPAEEGADRFAAYLGLSATGFGLNEAFEPDATEELRDLWTELMTPGEGEEYHKPIISCFCATYLPSLVSAFKANPDPYGPYHAMLLGVAQSVYFAKFMRSPAGADLYPFYVEQVLMPQCWTCEDQMGVLLRYIVGLMILSTYAHEYKTQMNPLSEATLVQFKGWLHDRASHAAERMQVSDVPRSTSKQRNLLDPNGFVLEHSLSMLFHLDGKSSKAFKRLMLTRRATFYNYAVRHAEAIDDAAIDAMRRHECTRCQTVAYCCQRQEHSKPCTFLRAPCTFIQSWHILTNTAHSPNLRIK
ncbi:hypothetical protein C8R46DRAFT_1354376, partial [Mycena filopes]